MKTLVILLCCVFWFPASQAASPTVWFVVELVYGLDDGYVRNPAGYVFKTEADCEEHLLNQFKHGYYEGRIGNVVLERTDAGSVEIVEYLEFVNAKNKVHRKLHCVSLFITEETRKLIQSHQQP